MPANDPQPGEVWTLSQPSFDSSGPGSAVVVTVERDQPEVADRVILYSRSGQRIVSPLRSFLLTWVYEHALAQPPAQCSISPCLNPAWFQQHVNDTNIPFCWAHLQADTQAEFRGSEAISGEPQQRCPACNAPGSFPGSGSHPSGHGYEIHTCGRCRRDWVLLYPTNEGDEACVVLAEDVHRIVGEYEDRNLVGQVRLGSTAFQMLQRAAGHLGDPPHLAGITLQVTQLPRGTRTVFVIGYQHFDIRRGVQRLGGSPDNTASYTAAQLQDPPYSQEDPSKKTFTNQKPRVKQHPLEPDPGTTWWHKQSYNSAHILDVTAHKDSKSLGLMDLFVKYRMDGAPEVQLLGDFLEYFTNDPPEPPCTVGEEWVDTQGHTVHIVALEERVAHVRDLEGRVFLLPYSQFPKFWAKVERRSVYERLADQEDAV